VFVLVRSSRLKLGRRQADDTFVETSRTARGESATGDVPPPAFVWLTSACRNLGHTQVTIFLGIEDVMH